MGFVPPPPWVGNSGGAISRNVVAGGLDHYRGRGTFAPAKFGPTSLSKRHSLSQLTMRVGGTQATAAVHSGAGTAGAAAAAAGGGGGGGAPAAAAGGGGGGAAAVGTGRRRRRRRWEEQEQQHPQRPPWRVRGSAGAVGAAGTAMVQSGGVNALVRGENLCEDNITHAGGGRNGKDARQARERGHEKTPPHGDDDDYSTRGAVIQKQKSLVRRIQAMGRSEKWWGVGRALLEARQSGLEVNLFMCNAAITAWGRCGRWKDAWALVNDMKLSTGGLPLPDEGSFTGLVVACGRAGQVHRARTAFSAMQDRGLRPTVTTYTALITAYGKAGLCPQVLALLKDMRADGIEPTVVTYTSAISACGQVGATQQALELLLDMARYGVQPNKRTYRAAIYACDRTHQCDEMMNVLLRMGGEQGKEEQEEEEEEEEEEEGWGSPHPLRLPRLDVEYYNALIAVSSKAGSQRKALEFLQEMRDSETVQPDEDSYILAIRACRRAPETALQLLREMQEEEGSRLQPTEKVYCAAISAFWSSGSCQTAIDLFEEMRDMGWRPNLPTYNALITACGRARKYAKALAVFDEMKVLGFRPDVASYTTAIWCWGKAGEYGEAFRLLGEMRSRGVQPSMRTYCAVIWVCGQAKPLEHAYVMEKLRELRIDDGLSLDLPQYTQLIQACANVGAYEKAVEFVIDLLADGLRPPDAAVFNIAIRACVKAGALTEAWDLVARMRGCGGGGSSSGIRPDAVTFSALVAGSCQQGGEGLSEALGATLREMRVDGVRPNSVIYSAAITAYGEAGDHDMVLSVLRDMRTDGFKPDMLVFKAVMGALALCGKDDAAGRMYAWAVYKGAISSPWKKKMVMMKGPSSSSSSSSRGSSGSSKEGAGGVSAVESSSSSSSPSSGDGADRDDDKHHHHHHRHQEDAYDHYSVLDLRGFPKGATKAALRHVVLAEKVRGKVLVITRRGKGAEEYVVSVLTPLLRALNAGGEAATRDKPRGGGAVAEDAEEEEEGVGARVESAGRVVFSVCG